MRKVRFSTDASTDLEEIWNYLAEWVSADLARQEIWRLRQQFELLAQWPLLGTVVQKRPHYRQFELRPYVIFYRQVDVGVEIARVVHGKRDGGRIFE